jgi:hypothetical protein
LDAGSPISDPDNNSCQPHEDDQRDDQAHATSDLGVLIGNLQSTRLRGGSLPLNYSQPGAGTLTQRHAGLINKNNRPASSIVISPFEQRLRAAAQCFCCNHKAARLAFECLHLTSIGARPCSHKLHSLAAARASDVLAVMHWNMSPSRSSQGGPLGPETSPSAGTVCNNRAN